VESWSRLRRIETASGKGNNEDGGIAADGARDVCFNGCAKT
jgi:hypothetical protein